VAVASAGAFQYRNMVEAGYDISKYVFAARSADPENFRLRSVDKASGEQTTIVLDVGAEPQISFCYTPASVENPARTFSLRLTTGNREYQASAGIRKAYNMFWGNSAQTSLSEAEIKVLACELRTNFQGPKFFALGSSTYRWFFIPEPWGTPEAFVDSNAAAVPFENPFVLDITNAFSVKIQYNCFRSTNTFSALDTMSATAVAG